MRRLSTAPDNPTDTSTQEGSTRREAEVANELFVGMLRRLFRWLLPRNSFLRVPCAGGFLALRFRHPLRRVSSPLALAPCKALHNQDGLLDLLPLPAEFRKH